MEIEAQSSGVDERTSSDLPVTQRQRYTSSGTASLTGTYSSGGRSDGRRLV